MSVCFHQPAGWLACLLLWLPLPQTEAAAEWPSATFTGETMGSRYRVTLVGSNLPAERLKTLQEQVDARLREINRQMSHYLPESELSRFNRAPAEVPFAVSPDFAAVVRFALDLSRRSQGAFDPTLAPLINLWGFGEKSAVRAVPATDQIRDALAQCGWEHLAVTARNELVKKRANLSLNLSALAKGFAVDEMVDLLQRQGFTNLYASLAGEVRVLGHNARGAPWLIGISAPLDLWRENDPMAAAVSLSHQAISTSGDYQKFFYDDQGRRHAHLLDPRTGWPVQNTVGSVSVVAPRAMLADALSTTLSVLGPEAGLRFIEGWTNAAALFICREKGERFRLIPSSRFAALTGWRPPPAGP